MEQTRKTPLQLIQDNLGTFALASLIYFLVSGATGNLPDNMIVTTISTLLTAVFSASQAAFYFRAINRQKPDISDMYNIFLIQEEVTKLISIILAKFIIDMIISVVTTALAFIPIINILAIIASAVISMMFIPILYLFVANPHYSTEYYLKASVAYMKGNLLKYLKVVLTYIIPLVLGYIAIVVFLPIVGVFLGAVFVLFGISRLGLAVAYFVADNIIPDEWYAGTAQF